MSRPLVSVVIPFHNYVHCLAEAIRSVLAQTWSPIELILVDDGSTDGSAELARRFAPPAAYLRIEHVGAAGARNRGVERATGDFLAFCDADDLWRPAKLERQMAACEVDPGLDVVFGHVREFLDVAVDPRACGLRPPRLRAAGALPSAMLIRREALRRVGPFAEGLRVAEWADWYSRMCSASLRQEMLAEILVDRRLHGSNGGLLGRGHSLEYVGILKRHLARRRIQA